MDHPTAADLARAPLFAGLDEHVRSRLAEQMDVKHFDAGRAIVTEGSAGYVFYVIASGEAAVTHDGERVRQLGPGDHLGEIAILGSGRRTATVTAISDVDAWSLFGTRFRALEAEQPDVAKALVAAMEARLGQE